jgi:hypothetical protein
MVKGKNGAGDKRINIYSLLFFMEKSTFLGFGMKDLTWLWDSNMILCVPCTSEYIEECKTIFP